MAKPCRKILHPSHISSTLSRPLMLAVKKNMANQSVMIFTYLCGLNIALIHCNDSEQRGSL